VNRYGVQNVRGEWQAYATTRGTMTREAAEALAARKNASVANRRRRFAPKRSERS
jgi:hypothetical protein